MDQYGKRGPLVKLGALCLLSYLTAATGAAACRLALLLAVDVSSSVDQYEDALQRQGLAAALIAPDVQTAFFGLADPVAIAVYEWSGRYNQEILLDWTVIDSPDVLLQASQKISQSRRSHNEFPTAMGFALGFGAEMLQRAPKCALRTIDMAGDGQNNDGFGPDLAYAEFPFEGVVVNGLVVNAADFEAETELIEFYKTEVIRGPGAFLEIAQGFEDYESAMRRKLERELSVPVFGAMDETGDVPG